MGDDIRTIPSLPDSIPYTLLHCIPCRYPCRSLSVPTRPGTHRRWETSPSPVRAASLILVLTLTFVLTLIVDYHHLSIAVRFTVPGFGPLTLICNPRCCILVCNAVTQSVVKCHCSPSPNARHLQAAPCPTPPSAQSFSFVVFSCRFFLSFFPSFFLVFFQKKSRKLTHRYGRRRQL